MNQLITTRTIDRTFIHCSASDNPKHDSIDVIRSWHLAREWQDIGYHFYISKDGMLHIGRDINISPAAQRGHNKNTIAICLGGLEHFTFPQMMTLCALCNTIKVLFPSNTFHGHCEVSNKTCPVFDYKTILNLDDQGHMQ